jgi:DNA polymerase alpha subunit A
MEDVRQEVKQILQRKGIENYTMNACRRKYAFELPDVPAEAAYLKLNYSFKGNETDDCFIKKLTSLARNLGYELESSIIGKTFSHVFGCSTGPLEHFIINNDVMGPCWLELKNVSPVESNVSRISTCMFDTESMILL